MSEAEEAAIQLGLEPMARLDVGGAQNVSELLDGLSKTAFTGRCLGEAVDVAETMLRDESWVVLTLSGAMTMAGLSLVIVEMIERGWIDCIVSTGALVGHGLTEDIGMHHYKANPKVPDAEYYKRRLNRVYDVIEPEENLDALESRFAELLSELASEKTKPLGTHDILRFFGEKLSGRGVLQAAAMRGVPVFIPAFTDSELGLDFAVFNERRRGSDEPTLCYDAFEDLSHYAQIASQQMGQGGKLGIWTIGGGVPRNWAQQVAPFVDVSNNRLKRDWPVPRFSYGVRMCPDPVHIGHLSGSTYSEGVTWGKFVPREEGGRYAEVLLDATVGWPLLVRALIDRGL